MIQRVESLWIPAALALLTLLLKLPTLETPAYWDETVWVLGAQELSQRGLLYALPGLHPPEAFYGHPPGLYVLAALAWSVRGPSLVVAHLLIAAFAAFGVAMTYLLGRHLAGAAAGVGAALLLLATPLYLSAAGFFLADVPLTALGVATVYFGLRGPYPAYFCCATAMLLIKEPALAVLAAFMVHLALTDGWRGAAARRRLALAAAPLAVGALFYAWQRLASGEWGYIGHEVALFYFDPREVWIRFRSVSDWLFVDQRRWAVSLLIAAGWLSGRSGWARKEQRLVVPVVLACGYVWSVLNVLPRYLLPVLPFLYLAGAQSLYALVPRPAWRRVGIAAVVLGFATWPLTPGLRGNGETDFGYLEVIRTEREAARFIARHHAGATVLAVWPQTSTLARPFLGHVEEPLRMVSFEQEPRASEDLILVSAPPPGAAQALRRRAEAEDWPLVRRFGDEDVAVDIYRRP